MVPGTGTRYHVQGKNYVLSYIGIIKLPGTWHRQAVTTCHSQNVYVDLAVVRQQKLFTTSIILWWLILACHVYVMNSTLHSMCVSVTDMIVASKQLTGTRYLELP